MVQMTQNAELDSSIIVTSILHTKDPSYCFDVGRNRYGSMSDLGILDPVEVVCTALEGSVSVATAILTTEAVVATSLSPRVPHPKRSTGHFSIDW